MYVLSIKQRVCRLLAGSQPRFWRPHPHIQASRLQPQEARLSCGATGSELRKNKQTSKLVLQFY